MIEVEFGMSIELRSNVLNKEEKQFPFELVELAKLVPHEMTIDHELESIKQGLIDSGMVYWPLILDKNSLLILDGHHRTKGLGELGYRFTPAVMIDYLDDDLIQVDTWYPIVNVTVEDVISELQKHDLQIIKSEVNSLDMPRLVNREITCVVGNETHLYNIIGERELVFHIIREKWLEGILYADNAEISLKHAGPSKTAIISWSYSKREILDFVLGGDIFLPKTTRHELKYLVGKCNVPLGSLK